MLWTIKGIPRCFMRRACAEHRNCWCHRKIVLRGINSGVTHLRKRIQIFFWKHHTQWGQTLRMSRMPTMMPIGKSRRCGAGAEFLRRYSIDNNCTVWSIDEAVKIRIPIARVNALNFKSSMPWWISCRQNSEIRLLLKSNKQVNKSITTSFCSNFNL